MRLTMTRGDTPQWSFAVTTSAGAAYDITGCSFWFTAKSELDDVDLSAVFQRTVGVGIAIVSAVGGTGTITLTTANTSSLDPEETTLYCDFQMKTADAKIYTLASGTLVVSPDVTISTS